MRFHFFLAVILVGCSRGDPPTWHGQAGADSVSPMPPPAVREAGVADAAHDAAPDVDPGVLPQTRERPSAAAPAFHARVEALWEGVVNDDPARAMAFFFPKTAYEQVKAIPYPDSDWKHRLVANFARDIHAAHAKLGRDATEAKLVGIDVPDLARWVDPGEEGNKLGYWRVYGTRLRYEVDGRPRVLGVSSMISWRGEWYVVHLTGFK